MALCLSSRPAHPPLQRSRPRGSEYSGGVLYDHIPGQPHALLCDLQIHRVGVVLLFTSGGPGDVICLCDETFICGFRKTASTRDDSFGERLLA